MTTNRRQWLLGSLGAATTLGAAPQARAAAWPERPLTFICP